MCDYYTELDAVCLHGDDSHGNYMMSGLEGVTSRYPYKEIRDLENNLATLYLREKVRVY